EISRWARISPIAPREGLMMRFACVLAAALLFGSVSQAAENPTRDHDAHCFTAIARHFEATRSGSADEQAFAKEMLNAEPYFAGKVRASFTDAELPRALQSADVQMSRDSKRREYAISCWQLFQIEMMMVTDAAQGKPVK